MDMIAALLISLTGMVYPIITRTMLNDFIPNKLYRSIIIAEQAHEKRYLRLLERMENEQTFHRPEPVVWQCRKCGYTYIGRKAPDRCPACLHAKGYFEVKAENY